MDKPRTNTEAFKIVLDNVGTKTALANGLHVVKQLVSRWHEIPPRYLGATAELTNIPIECILPELETSVTALIGRPSAPLLPELIRLLEPKAPSWHDRRKTKPRKPKRKK